MSILFVRRRNLGRGSIKGVRQALGSMGIETSVLKPWLGNTHVGYPSVVVRWGTTAETGLSSTVTLNKSEAIHRVNDKKGFRLLVGTEACLFTTTIINSDQLVEPSLFPLVVRTARHAQGRNLWLVNNQEELIQRTSVLGDWYASRFVDKEAEYRVYVANGRVVTVAQKTPADPNQIAWNVAQGGRFDVVRWGLWPLEACRVAIEAFRFSGLDFGGVDVMIEKGTNKPYVLEINSAPSLPSLSNGQVSYRQQVMAKYFKYVLENGNEWIEPLGFSHYKEVIHPCSI